MAKKKLPPPLSASPFGWLLDSATSSPGASDQEITSESGLALNPSKVNKKLPPSPFAGLLAGTEALPEVDEQEVVSESTPSLPKVPEQEIDSAVASTSDSNPDADLQNQNLGLPAAWPTTFVPPSQSIKTGAKSSSEQKTPIKDNKIPGLMGLIVNGLAPAFKEHGSPFTIDYRLKSTSRGFYLEFRPISEDNPAIQTRMPLSSLPKHIKEEFKGAAATEVVLLAKEHRIGGGRSARNTRPYAIVRIIPDGLNESGLSIS